MENKIRIWLIECRTGCTCCQYENHMRGPYRNSEDASRRMNHYLTAGKYHPLASQFAPRGRYAVQSKDVELISNGRFIIDDTVINSIPLFVSVAEDGTIDGDSESERFDY